MGQYLLYLFLDIESFLSLETHIFFFFRTPHKTKENGGYVKPSEFDTSALFLLGWLSCLVGFVQCSIAKWVLISFHVFRTYESQSLNSATSLLRGASRSVGVSGVVLIRRRSEWNSLVIKIEKGANRGRDCFSSRIYSGSITTMKELSIRFRGLRHKLHLRDREKKLDERPGSTAGRRHDVATVSQL